ncbi:MAG: hypothetical protein ABIH64_03925, partial [Nanoarchaeota archaeon]
KKDRQIKCMYRNCIKNNMEAGLSTTSCDFAYKERECLYVESAQFKLHGYMGGFWSRLGDYIWSNLPFLLGALVYLGLCADYRITGSVKECTASLAVGIKLTGARPVLCGIMGIVQTALEIYSMFSSKYSFNNYDQELGGEDYCGSEGEEE